MLVQERRVELVALVVVVADRVAVPAGAVLLAGEHGLLAGRTRAAADDAEPQRGPRPAQPVPPSRRHRRPRTDDRPDRGRAPRRDHPRRLSRRRRRRARARARPDPTADDGVPCASAARRPGRRPGPPRCRPRRGCGQVSRRAPPGARRPGVRPRNGRGRGRGARRLLVVVESCDPPAFGWWPLSGCAGRSKGLRGWRMLGRCSPQDRRSSHVRVRSKVPEFRTTRAGGRFDRRALCARPSPRAPCAGAFLVSGAPRSPASCNGRWSPDRREEAHAHAGEGRGDRRDHRAVPELQCGRAHRVPRADRGAADPAASFPRCGQQLRRRQEHPDEAGGGLGRFLRPRPAAQRTDRDRLHRR